MHENMEIYAKTCDIEEDKTPNPSEEVFEDIGEGDSSAMSNPGGRDYEC